MLFRSAVEDMEDFGEKLAERLEAKHPRETAWLLAGGKLSNEERGDLRAALEECLSEAGETEAA